jgi:cation transport ATPase
MGLVEQGSEHLLATAIVQGARERGVKPQPVSDFASVTGGGVTGPLVQREIVAGKLAFLQQRGIGGAGALFPSSRTRCDSAAPRYEDESIRWNL